MFCENCGKEIPDKAVFCPYCGAAVGENLEISKAPTEGGQNGFAIASMILGIIGLVLGWCIIGSIPAVIGIALGSYVLICNKSGKKMAIAGVITGGIGLLFALFILFVWVVFDNNTTTSLKSENQQITVEAEEEKSKPTVQATPTVISPTATPIPTPTETPVPDNNFPEDRVGFYTNGYWGMNIKSINNDTGVVVYDGYEEASSDTPSSQNWEATIVDANTLNFYDTVFLTFTGDSFEITNGTDAMIMSSGAGSTASHDCEHGAGVYQKGEKPTRSQSVTRNITLYEGHYCDSRAYGDNSDCPEDYCELVISNVTDTGFDFEIFRHNRHTGTLEPTFLLNTAVFTGDGTTATYYGQEYTLNFHFDSITSIRIDGFDEVKGISLQNNGIPGHEFS